MEVKPLIQGHSWQVPLVDFELKEKGSWLTFSGHTTLPEVKVVGSYAAIPSL